MRPNVGLTIKDRLFAILKISPHFFFQTCLNTLRHKERHTEADSGDESSRRASLNCWSVQSCCVRPPCCECAAGGYDCLTDRFEFHTMCVRWKTWREQGDFSQSVIDKISVWYLICLCLKLFRFFCNSWKWSNTFPNKYSFIAMTTYGRLGSAKKS